MNNNLLIDWKDNQSKTIDLLRFPLAIFVIFVHMNPITCNPFTSDFSFFSVMGIYNILGLILSQGIGHIAVPNFLCNIRLLVFR